jgi:sigma-B regulation protein RsbU (phosphoserine phosphatase)
MHVSIFYGIIDPRRGTLSYANAGHPQAFLVPHDGEPVRLAATAPPLGLGDLSLLKGITLPWKAGRDLLCVFSDGFSETADASGQRFGEDRVLSAVRRHAALPAPEIVDAVFAEVESFATGPADDDRTMVLVRR